MSTTDCHLKDSPCSPGCECVYAQNASLKTRVAELEAALAKTDAETIPRWQHEELLKAEREACAKVADEGREPDLYLHDGWKHGYHVGRQEAAGAIRSRGGR